MMGTCRALLWPLLIMATDAVMPKVTEPTTLVELLREFGFPVVLIIFFVWQGRERESRMATRINELEKFNEKTLIDIVTANTEAIGAHASSLHELVTEWGRRPCAAMADIQRLVATLSGDRRERKEARDADRAERAADRQDRMEEREA